MKLAVSNIAWDNAQLTEHLSLLRELGCQGVELAPSCIWPEPVEAPAHERQRVRQLIGESGLELVGFHALLFTRPELQLFLSPSSRRGTVDYLIDLARLCGDMGGSVLVLGSPANRRRHGRPYQECLGWAADAFSEIADAGQRSGVVFCIEPLGPDETEFLTSGREGAGLVETVGHPFFRLHLDAKALLSTGEDATALLGEYGHLLHHVHVGDPGLSPPGSTGADHAPFGDALRRIGYDRYVSIEMRRQPHDTKDAIVRSVAYVKRCYGSH